jgi:hypothetical protein
MLAIGVIAGWSASRLLDSSPAPIVAAATNPDTWLLHVASSDPARMQLALDRAESLTTGSGAAAGRRVEIVANEGGLNLLRSDMTPMSCFLPAAKPSSASRSRASACNSCRKPTRITRPLTGSS